MHEVRRRPLRPTDTEPERAARPVSATDELGARLLGLQRTAGNRADAGLLRQPAPGQAPATDAAAGAPGEQGRLADLRGALASTLGPRDPDETYAEVVSG